MGTQGTGRKRSTKKERSTAEDDALNLIAREAEARLAAKRAARAEAREIRMKELERQQKEFSDDDERMSVGSRGSVRVEDRDYLEKGSRAASALTAATLTSLGGTSSRRGSGETALTVDAETSLREIKGALAEVEEKYRKAMVSNAQLDNEKSNLMYQVDTLKDSLMELEELLSESRRGYDEKVKEYEREKHAHSVLQFQFNEMKETLKQSEELLNKHGIVLGPDLNVNGDVGEPESDGTSGGDSAAQPAQDSQTSPTEGNSMLGSTEETQLRSSGEEEVDPQQRREILEEAGKKHLSSDVLCNVSDVETSSKEQPTEERHTCLPTEEEEESVGETESNELQVDINKNPITEAKDVPESQEIVTSPEENAPGTDLGEMVDTQCDDVRETSNNLAEAQENKQEDVEESNLRNTESCPQQKVTEDVVNEADESVQDVSYTEPQQEPENAEDAENDEADESKGQPQGATASGKKKKRKRRGKKKGGPNEEVKQQKDAKEGNGNDKGNGKTGKDVKLAARDNGSTTEPDNDVSATEVLKETKMDDVMKDAVDAVGVEPTQNVSHIETLQESKVDGVTSEQKEEQSLETETVDVAEAAVPTENVCPAETLNESRTDQLKDEQDMEQTSETVEEAESKTSPDASDLNDDSEGIETDGLDKRCTSSVDNSKSDDITTEGEVHTESGTANSEEDEMRSVDETKSEHTTEKTFESTNCNEDTDAESHVQSNVDAAVDKSEPTSDSETKDNASVAPLSTDDKSPEEATETAKDVEEPEAEIDQGSPSPSQDDDKSELKPGKSEKEELNEEFREPEDVAEPDNSSKSPLETAAQSEHLDNVDSQMAQCADQTDESNVKVSKETDTIDSSEIIKTPDSPKEAPEVASLVEEDHNGVESTSAEDPEHKDKSEDDDSSPPNQQDGDEEDGDDDDDEGQSFDFDDMDIDAAIASKDSSKDPEQAEVEEAVEVTSDENDGSSNEKTQDEPVDGEDEKCTVDATDKQPDTKQDNQNSSAHEETTSENAENEPQGNAGVADGEEVEVSNVGESAAAVVEGDGAEDVNQAMSSSVEEGLDAVKHEMQSEVSPKSADQVGGNKEPPPSAKDVKKNGKKGKTKGKEDKECKMS